MNSFSDKTSRNTYSLNLTEVRPGFQPPPFLFSDTQIQLNSTQLYCNILAAEQLNS